MNIGFFEMQIRPASKHRQFRCQWRYLPDAPIVRIWLLVAGACLGVALASSRTDAGDTHPPISGDSKDATIASVLRPMLQTYCWDCHDAGSEIDLQSDLSAGGIHDDRPLWIRVLNQVRAGSMPPEDGTVMDAATRKQFETVVDDLANAVDCVRNPNAGRVALRRLNRYEYRNTIRDLTGVDYQPADDFPGDDVGYGFDNVGDVLSLPPILMERYLDAAETIVGRAILTPPPAETIEVDRSPDSLVGADKFGARGGRLTLASNGTVAIEKTLPWPGRYRLTVTASGNQGGPEVVQMTIGAGGRKRTFDVPGEDPVDVDFDAFLPAGKRRFEIAFINDFYDGDAGIDRNLILHHVRLVGEQNRTTFLRQSDKPRSHDALVFRTPSDEVPFRSAAAAVMNRFASRAFRRPAKGDEVRRLVELAESVHADGGTYEESIQVAMQAVLVSPHFLFKIERPRNIQIGGPMAPIGQFELATRLSYFLWSSMPDDELFAIARRGQMRNGDVIIKKIASMMRDPRSYRLITQFTEQWLQLRNLDDARPDAQLFGAFDDEIRDAMRRETLMFVADIFRNNRPVTDLLTSRETYLNERLAKFYGISSVSGTRFRKVSLDGSTGSAATADRGGLLTQGSVLVVTSNPTRTSPVQRGKFILENLLNLPPPPAPPNIPELDKGQLTGTLREQMEQHREDPACAACHNMMDPLGFAMEHFDAIGRYRSRDGRDDIDASGSLPDGTSFEGVGDLRALLSGPRREQFVRCLVEKLLIYAVGRGTDYYDRCAIDEIMSHASRNQYRFATVIAAIVASDPFQKQGVRE